MPMLQLSSAHKKDKDANLVMLSLGGDREAFCEIVCRYQNLLCSIAYSSVGDIKHSEDIAQEAFVEAWKKLDTLRDPEKLKSWLCGILRFKISHFRRKDDSTITENLDSSDIENKHADDASLETQAISQQQQELMWKVLGQMDCKYREPLILYYRDQQSVEQVAEAFDLTIDTTKQRLSRGRKILKQTMSAFVENTLAISKPGAGFTAAVLLSISTVSPPTKAAGVGASLAKAGTVWQISTLVSLLASVSGLISSYFGVKAALDQSRTENERRLTKQTVSLFLGLALMYVISLLGLRVIATHDADNGFLYNLCAQCVALLFVISYLLLTNKMFAAVKALRAQERIFNPAAFHRDVDKVNAKEREYISSIRVFGVPLFHFQFATPEYTDRPAFGWVASGAKAYGLLFAWGGVAIAPVSVGILAIGFISVGAVGIGLASVSAVALGIVAFGSSAIGYKAYSSLSSLGWEGAVSGGFSMAIEGAIGPIATAKEINNEQAANLTNLDVFGSVYLWVLLAITVFVVVPAFLNAKQVKKRMG